MLTVRADGLTLTSPHMKGKEGRYLVCRGEEKMKEEKKNGEGKGGKYQGEGKIVVPFAGFY